MCEQYNYCEEKGGLRRLAQGCNSFKCHKLLPRSSISFVKYHRPLLSQHLLNDTFKAVKAKLKQ